MMTATESERVAALHNYHIMDTPPDPTFERITDLAAHSFGVPMSCLTLVDSDRMWMKSSHGTDIRELPHEPGMCLTTVQKGVLHIVPDTLEDAECRENSTVKAGIRFYAAAPLRTSEGHCIGTICVLDMQPRSVTRREEEILESLARFAMSEIEIHRARHEMELVRRARLTLAARTHQAQRLESLGTLAGGIAHDFNNLLVGVLGNASMAQAALPPDAPLRPIIDGIEVAALRARDLINELMAYAGRSRIESTPVNLAELITETTHLLQTAISRKASLETRFESGAPLIIGDSVQIRQVVMNLITNASDALRGEPGAIHITVARRSVSADETIVTRDGGRLPDGDYVCLEVSDTGCGMNAETREQMFEPFFTTRDTGRGLGLAAVSGILAAHRGAITVDTTPGLGTRVSVLFPATQVISQVAAVTLPPPLTKPPSVTTVLVVDDEAMVRDVARTMLERENIKVLEARDGGSALKAIERNSEAISAVLLDVSMPDLDGDDVCRRIHAVCPGMPVILTSGHSHEAVAEDLSATGPVAFLQKPYRRAQLLRAIHDVMSVGR